MPVTRVVLLGDVYKSSRRFETILKKTFPETVILHKSTLNEVIELVVDASVDAIVCTYDLPSDDGLRLVQRLRGLDYRNLPVIVIFEEANDKLFDESYGLGADRCLLRKDIARRPAYLANEVKNLILVSRSREGSFINTLKRKPNWVPKQHDLLLNALQEPAFLLDSKGIVVVCNKEAAKRFDLKLNEIVGKNAFDLFPDEVIQQRKKAFQAAIRSGKPVKHKDKYSDKSCEFEARPLFSESGHLEYIAVFLKDISQLALLESELQVSKDDLHAIIDATDAGIHVTDLNLGWTHYNRAFLEMWGFDTKTPLRYSEREINRMKLEKIESSEGYLERKKEIQEHPEKTSEDIIRFKDGRIFLRQSFPRWQKGYIVGRVWLFRDITKQETAKHKLRQNEEQQRSLLDALSDGIVLYDENFNVIYANEVATRNARLDPTELASDTDEIEIAKRVNIRTEEGIPIPPDQVPGRRALAGEEIRGMIVRYTDSEGDERIGHLNAIPLRDSSGKIIKAMVNVHDITDLKTIEQNLRSTHDQLDAILHAVPGALIVYDKNSHISYCNDLALKRFGVDSLEEIQGSHPGAYFSHFDFFDEDGNHFNPDDFPHARLLRNEPSDAMVIRTVRRDSGEQSWVTISGVPVFDEHGEVEFVVISVFDITDRKKIEEELVQARDNLEEAVQVRTRELQQSQKYLERAQHIAKLGHFTLDMKTGITEVSGQLVKMTGVDPAKPLALRDYLKVVHPEDRRDVLERISVALDGKEKYSTEHRLVSPENKISYVYTEGEVERNKDGSPRRIVGTMQDITRLKKAELNLRLLYDQLENRSKELQVSQQYLKRAQEIASMGHWIWSYTDDQATLSDGGFNILGIEPRDRFTFADYLDFVHPDDKEHVKANARERLDKRPATYIDEHRIVRADGEIRYLSTHSKLEFDEDGKPLRTLGVMQDITRVKRAELELKDLYEELKENQEYLKRAQRIAKIGHFIWNVEEDKTEASEQLNRILGVDQSKLWSVETYLDVVHPDDRERVKASIDEAMGGADRYRTEHRIVNSDGNTLYIYAEGEIERDEAGAIRRIVGTLQDITVRKEAEIQLQHLYDDLKERTAELQESRDYLERSQRIANMGHFIWDVPKDVTVSSSQLKYILGQGKDEFWTIKDYMERIHPDDLGSVQVEIDRILQGGSRLNVEYRMRCSSGEFQYLYTEGEIERDEAGNVTNIIGITQDITRLKLAEFELKELNEKLEERTRELQENQKYLKWGERIAKLGYFVWDFNTDTATVSEEFNRMMDAEDGKVWSWEEFSGLVHPDDREKADEIIKESVATGKQYKSEYRVTTLGGREMYLADVGEVIFDEEGKPNLLVGVQQDITERKMAELELTRLNEELKERSSELGESQSYLKRAQRMAQLGHFIHYIAENRGVVSEEFNRIMGSEDLGKEWNLDEYLSYVHDDDREELAALLEDSITNGTTYSHEHRICRPDGTTVYVSAEEEIEYDEEGKPYRMIGAIQDVTKRKNAELELRKLNEKLEAKSADLRESRMYLERAQKIASVGHFVMYFSEEQDLFSAEFNRILGYDPNKVWDVDEYHEFIHPDDREKSYAIFKEAYDNGTSYSIEHRFIRPDGSIVYVHTEAEIELDDEGVPFRAVGTLQDITKRKQAELELRQLYMKLENRTEELKESRMYLERAQRIANVGHFVYYVEEQNGLVSEQFNRLMGCTDLKKQWSHDEYIKSVHPEDQEETQQVLEAAFANATSYTSDHRVVHPDGTVLYLHAEAEMELNEDGTAYRAIGTIQDVTKRKIAELELRRLNEELEQRSAELKESRLYLERAQRIALVGHYVYYIAEDKSFVSDQFNRIMGIDLSRRVWKFGEYLAQIHPEDFEEIKAELGAAFSKGKPFSVEHRILRPDGTEAYVAAEAEIELNEDGTPYRSIGVLRDITRQKRTELELRELYEQLEKRSAELRESRKYLELAQELAHVGHFVYFIDEDRSVISDEIRRIMGEEDPERAWSVGEYLNNVHPDDRERVAGEISAIVEKNEPYKSEHRLCRPDGTVIHVYSEAEIEAYEDGNPTRILGMIQDITSRKIAELELRELHAKLEERVEQRTLELKEANEELQTFSYAVSHDLRAPLRHLRGYSDMLREFLKDSADEQSALCLTRISESTEHMDEIITGLLWLSRSARLEPERDDVDLSALAEEQFNNLRRTEPDRRVTVRITGDLVEQCDEKLVNVVLQNLISNAWKFTEKTDEAVIEFGMKEMEEEQVYFVRDNGVGFNTELYEDLFLPFKRLHDSSEFQGIGIGLATVKRVIDRHGGRIWAESTQGEGATFFFTLK